MGFFPSRLKYVNIRPLFKKDNKNYMSNYRPISIITLSNIFGKVIQTRLLKHVTDHILSMEQYGFRTQLKTDNATYQLTNEIQNALNDNLLICSTFCDLENALDCVNHKILNLNSMVQLVSIINFTNPI
jgi:hypothetical protein